MKPAKRSMWTAQQDDVLIRLYPDHTAQACADVLGRPLTGVYRRAKVLGLEKSAAFYASEKSGRDLHNKGSANRFSKGHTTWNKGKKGYDPGGRSAETRFKKGSMSGQAQYNYKPIGSLRVSPDGYLERKVTDDPNVVGAQRWKGIHRLVWIEHNGPIPPGFAVAFKSRRPELDEAQITLDKLELVSRVQIMRENTRHQYPPELNELISKRAALKRRINNLEKQREEQDAGCP